MGEIDRLPDVTGLPIFKVSDVAVEVCGDEVHIACGMKVFGQVQWLYVVVMTATDYLAAKDQYSLASMAIERVAQLAH